MPTKPAAAKTSSSKNPFKFLDRAYRRRLSKARSWLAVTRAGRILTADEGVSDSIFRLRRDPQVLAARPVAVEIEGAPVRRKVARDIGVAGVQLGNQRRISEHVGDGRSMGHQDVGVRAAPRGRQAH